MRNLAKSVAILSIIAITSFALAPPVSAGRASRHGRMLSRASHRIEGIGDKGRAYRLSGIGDKGRAYYLNGIGDKGRSYSLRTTEPKDHSRLVVQLDQVIISALPVFLGYITYSARL